MGIIAQVWHVLITALDSDDWRRQAWASDKIMSSWLAHDHPLAPERARRRSAATDVSVQSNKTVTCTSPLAQL